MIRYLISCISILAALLSGLMCSATASPVPEYEMKAVYLYNFATLTTWPSQTEKIVRLCVLGKDRFGGTLEGLTSNSSGGVRIMLSYVPNIQAARFCQILFIDASERGNVADILKQLDRLPILTVTDNQELFQSGFMVGLFLENKRLAFEVNYAKALDARLSMSSQLLRVARKVH